jgi:hypothetical protein
MAINREEWLNQAVSELRGIFDANGFPVPANVRVTCGFPSKHARSLNRAIGEHWSDSASTDATHEILISPVVDDPFEVFGILVHELSHSATDGCGHQGRFVQCIRKVWLEGKPTATVIGETFRANFGGLIEGLGAYPHSRLNVQANRKVQGTRMLKASCPHCNYTNRLSSKWASVGLPVCPVDGHQLSL